jgi:hypothetical protein
MPNGENIARAGVDYDWRTFAGDLAVRLFCDLAASPYSTLAPTTYGVFAPRRQVSRPNPAAAT